MKILKENYTVDFMNYGSITVPKGTPTTNETASGIDENYNFVNSFEWVKKDYASISNILIHDLTYHGINVPNEFLTNI